MIDHGITCKCIILMSQYSCFKKLPKHYISGKNSENLTRLCHSSTCTTTIYSSITTSKIFINSTQYFVLLHYILFCRLYYCIYFFFEDRFLYITCLLSRDYNWCISWTVSFDLIHIQAYLFHLIKNNCMFFSNKSYFKIKLKL